MFYFTEVFQCLSVKFIKPLATDARKAQWFYGMRLHLTRRVVRAEKLFHFLPEQWGLIWDWLKPDFKSQ